MMMIIVIIPADNKYADLRAPMCPRIVWKRLHVSVWKFGASKWGWDMAH